MLESHKLDRTFVKSKSSTSCDTIRDAILTCARKLTRVSLIYRTETTTKNVENRKTEKFKKTDMLRSIGKQSRESVESVLKKKRKVTVERICRRGGSYSLY